MATPRKQPKSAPKPPSLAQPDYEQPGVERPHLGEFVEVVGSEHDGLYGVYYQNDQFDKNGEPTHVLVRSRDHGSDFSEFSVVPVENLQRSYRKGR